VNRAPTYRQRSNLGSRSSLWPAGTALAFATAVVVATEFIVVGLLPELARDLNVSLALAGHFVSWFALASAVAGPVLTIATASLAPRQVVLLALLPFIFGCIGAAWLSTYEAMVAARILQGAALPVLVSVGGAALMRMAGTTREGEAVSLLYYGVIAGTALAMPAGVVLAGSVSWQATFLALGGLALLAATPFLRRSLQIPDLRRSKVTSQLGILMRPVLCLHLLLSAMLFAAMFTPYTYLVAVLESSAGLNENGVAAVLMGFGLTGIIGNWLAGRPTGDEATRASAVVIMVLTIVMTCFPLTGGSLIVLLPLLAVWGAAQAAAFLLSQVRIMVAAPEAPAFAASLNIAAANLGITVGALTGGVVADRYGPEATGFAGAAIGGLALANTILLFRTGAR
jgi:MFS transporter, DHA1 family, inner membrane transport protein